MSDWTSGYVADIAYTFGYYAELNPLRIKLAFLHAGLACPEMANACELGFGQGMSANLHAAASVTQWHGTDFNPSQAGFAQELASISGTGAKLFDEAFTDFAARSDLPEFDYIGLHGIWSWISDENRAVIVEFIRRKLKVGGVLYISYNTQPGWASFAPMRHLMTEHAEIIGAEGNGIVSRINGALEFTEKLLETQPLYARVNTQIGERIKKVKEQNRHYLAHEYFNRDWLPMHFATMTKWLESAKLSYACSAHYLDHIDAINLSSEQQQFLNDIPDAGFKETTRDFIVNQQFRRDYWVRGPRKLSDLAQAEQLRQLRILLIQPRHDISLKVNGSLGEATMQDHIYAPILDAMSDHQIISLGQLEQATQLSLAQILQAAIVLIGSSNAALVQDDAQIAKAKKACEKLNNYLCNQARGSSDISYLASPVSGGGVAVGRFQQLFLLARSQGKKHPAEMAQFAWQILAMQNQKLVKQGITIENTEDNIAELTQQAQLFCDKQIGILKALGIV
ncbi:class I SAM-dependent methyltransferase [Iodobacter sp.]|uniref:class I SAM-dependent methyltransferase n=1 Tax=Iodobacter sp. TaxID=1915058 RepID=UPI0025F89253|nr:class I SAM-dependent methyltransferase [Iodobacter sp.]